MNRIPSSAHQCYQLGACTICGLCRDHCVGHAIRQNDVPIVKVSVYFNRSTPDDTVYCSRIVGRDAPLLANERTMCAALVYKGDMVGRNDCR